MSHIVSNHCNNIYGTSNYIYSLFIYVCFYICRYTYLRSKKYGYPLVFVDPAVASQKMSNMDKSDKNVEAYILNVMEKSVDKELILWPFNKE